jgi:hypothetical protein
MDENAPSNGEIMMMEDRGTVQSDHGWKQLGYVGE